MLELCMFAEASKNQEELSLVGTRGKLEAFAPSHGQREDDASQVDFSSVSLHASLPCSVTVRLATRTL